MESQLEQAVRKLFAHSQMRLTDLLDSLEERTKLKQKEEMCAKSRIVVGLINEEKMDGLEEEVKEFGDSDLLDGVRAFRDRLEKKQSDGQEFDKAEPKLSKNRSEKMKEFPKEKEKGSPNHNESLIKGVLSKFIKADDTNVKQMILPQRQPKHYFDPIKGKYIFQGQEQQEVKQVLKPPPAKKITANISKKTERQTEKVDSFQQMMAPPIFKRKSTKKKSQTTKKIPIEPTFQSLQQSLASEFSQTTEHLLVLFKTFLQSKSSLPDFPCEMLSTLQDYSQKIYKAQEFSEQLMVSLFELDKKDNERIMEDVIGLGDKLRDLELREKENQSLRLRLENANRNEQFLIKQMEVQRQEISTMLVELQYFKTLTSEHQTQTYTLAQYLSHSTSQLQSLQQQLYRTTSAYQSSIQNLRLKMEEIEKEKEQQTQQLQLLIMAQQSSILSQKADLETLTQELQSAHEPLSQALSQKTLLNQLYMKANEAIENLENELREAKKMEPLVHMWERKYQELEAENMELLADKLELLKTKDQILERLAVMKGQQIKAKQNAKSIDKPDKKQDDTPTPEPPNNPVQPEASKPAGFLSSFSSYFTAPVGDDPLGYSLGQF